MLRRILIVLPAVRRTGDTGAGRLEQPARFASSDGEFDPMNPGSAFGYVLMLLAAFLIVGFVVVVSLVNGANLFRGDIEPAVWTCPAAAEVAPDVCP